MYLSLHKSTSYTSNGRANRIANLLELLNTRIHLPTDSNKPLDSKHPFAAELVVEHVADLGRIPFDCYAQHGYAQGPGGFAYRQVHVFIIGLYVLPHEAAVHYVVD